MRLVRLLIFLHIAAKVKQCVAPHKAYVLAANQVLFEKLFGSASNNMLSTIPFCYNEEVGKHDDTSTALSNMTMEAYYERNSHKKSAVVVEMKFQVLQIVDMNEKTKTIRMVISTSRTWHDCRLRWSKNDSNSNLLQLTPYTFKKLNIFIPAMRVLEALDPKESLDSETRFTINSDGAVTVWDEYMTQFSCNIDLRMYPFDIQQCYLTFESVYSRNIVDMKSLFLSKEVENENFDLLNRYMRSDQWCLTVLDPTKMHRTECQPKPDSFPGECAYEALQYRIILRRNPDYQLINLLLPAFLIVIISSCVFIVPPGSGDKMGLSVSILLSLYMFTQLMYDMMPDTGSFVPLLSQYFLVSIGLVSTSCVYSSISAVFASALPAPPRCLRKLVVYLGPILICDMIRSRQKRSKSKRRDKKEQQKDLPINEVSQQQRHSIGAIEPLWAATPQSQDKEAGNGQDPSKTVSDVNEDYEDKEHEFVGFSLDQSDKLTWAAVGALFDRLFFILHVLSTLTVATMYLVQGFTPWKEYGGLNLTSRDFQYICAQSDLQNDPHSKSFCPKNKTEFKLV